MIRSAGPADAAAICAIYNPYVLNTIITFEEQAVSITEMENRILEVVRDLPWLVAEEDGQILGYAYASKWKSRCAYRYAVESTVYLQTGLAGRGLGTLLYRALLADLRGRGMHTVIGGIALPNPASVALHEKLGFVQVAHFKEVGWKLERRIDVGYWQLILTPTAPSR